MRQSPPAAGQALAGASRARLPRWIPAGFLRLHGQDLSRLQRLLDPVCIALLFYLCNEPSSPITGAWGSAGVSLLVFCVAALILPLGNLYCSFRQTSLWQLVEKITVAWLVVLAVLLLIGFALKVTAVFSRIALSLWALASWFLLFVSHIGGRKFLRWYRIRGGNSRLVVFWGGRSQAVLFYRQLQNLPHLGIRLVAWFDAPDFESVPLPEDMPASSGGLSHMRQWLTRFECDHIYVGDVSISGLPMTQLIRFFGDTCRPVSFLPAWAQPSMSLHADMIGSCQAITLWGGENTPLNRNLKRAFDLLLGSFLLFILAPLLLVLSGLVAYSSPGPIFFWQDRYGLDGRRFRVVKFRTMSVTESGMTPGLQQARRQDPRVTPLGRVLRRWSLDELPQLFNVLRGDMSLVGPRPHAVEHNEQYRRLIPGYMQRHLFKPGITGLAQIEGWRGETADLDSMVRRVDADLRYQRDWSLGLDVSILLRTLANLRSPAAY